ncbi:hypothetical protein NQZ68_031463, partial [Dissostichus eleginoides]
YHARLQPVLVFRLPEGKYVTGALQLNFHDSQRFGEQRQPGEIEMMKHDLDFSMRNLRSSEQER